MRYSVLHDGEVIGSSDLEAGDLSMGVVFGRFAPTLAYERVRPVFLLFTQEKYEDYYRARDALSLQLQSDSGSVVQTIAIHIYDFSNELGLDGLELEVHLTDASSWRSTKG